MSSPRRNLALLALSTIALVGTLGACGDDGSSDPATTGPTKQAIEKLRDFGLTADQAECIVDQVGAESVVEATDLNAYTDSQQYQDAAEACIDAG